jgi:cytochrome oxidase Cu insertion factor (SCO1/SenC/PrrC family)
MMSGTDQNRAHRRAEVLIGARRRRRRGLRSRWGWRALGLALLVALASPSGEAVRIGGPFELVDQHGAPRTDADFRGRYMLMYFGFTHCPDTCPTALLKMTEALEALAELDAAKAERVVPVFISVDPERDTPEALRSYAEHFHRRLVALTGTPRQLEALGRVYGVFFAKVPTGERGEYLMDHASFVYLIGPEGKYIRHFESDVSVDDFVAALRQDVVVAEVGGS